MKARYAGTCRKCRQPIEVGDEIKKEGGWVHTTCEPAGIYDFSDDDHGPDLVTELDYANAAGWSEAQAEEAEERYLPGGYGAIFDHELVR